MFYKKLCVSIARGQMVVAVLVEIHSTAPGHLSPSENFQIWQDILLP